MRNIIVAMTVILAAAWIIFQIPGVQTFLTKRVVSVLESKLGGKIEFSSVHLKPFNTIILKDFRLIDDNPLSTSYGEVLDTVAKAGSVTASFSLKGLFKNEGLHLGRVSVTDGAFTFVSEPGGSNLKRVFPPSGKEPKPEKEMGELFDASKVQVEGFRFRYINLRREHPAKQYGIDWADMDVTVKRLEAHDLSLAGSDRKKRLPHHFPVRKHHGRRWPDPH